MAAQFMLTILAPDRCFLREPVEEVVFSTPEGRIGIMAGHMPIAAAVAEGTIDIRIDGEWKTAAVSQGFAEITYTSAELFVDTVEWADEIDAARAREALERAQQRLKNDISRREFAYSQAAIARALARLKAAEAIRHE